MTGEVWALEGWKFIYEWVIHNIKHSKGIRVQRSGYPRVDQRCKGISREVENPEEEMRRHAIASPTEASR